MIDVAEDAFVMFARQFEPGLRIALVASHGADRGLEATNDALTYAWQHWARVSRLDNPAGYLYRVAQRKARRRRLTLRTVLEPPDTRHPWIEPRLSEALAALSPRQRQVVVLVESYQFTFREAADLLGVSVSSVQTHLDRGLEHLRLVLGVPSGI